jgi:hypothetical protein
MWHAMLDINHAIQLDSVDIGGFIDIVSLAYLDIFALLTGV